MRPFIRLSREPLGGCESAAIGFSIVVDTRFKEPATNVRMHVVGTATISGIHKSGQFSPIRNRSAVVPICGLGGTAGIHIDDGHQFRIGRFVKNAQMVFAESSRPNHGDPNFFQIISYDMVPPECCDTVVA